MRKSLMLTQKSLLVIVCALTCLVSQETLAAVKYKRFPRCPEGLVTAATCECHAVTSRHFHYCHAGQYCHADGTCHQ